MKRVLITQFCARQTRHSFLFTSDVPLLAAVLVLFGYGTSEVGNYLKGLKIEKGGLIRNGLDVEGRVAENDRGEG